MMKMTTRVSFYAPLALTFCGACSSAHPDPGGSSASALLSAGQTDTITDYTGLCVDVRGGQTASSTPVDVSTCNGTLAQTWTYTNGALVGLGGKCLDVQWAQTANGTPVQLYDCNGTAAQQWTYTNGSLVGIGGKCLDVDDFNSTPGQVLQIWDCNGGQNQLFDFSGTGNCNGSGGSMDAGSGATDAGTGTGASDSGTGTGTSDASSGGTDLQRAQKFVSGLHVGVDIERARITYMTYQGNPINQSPAYFQYLKSVGVDHIRIFYPWSPSFLNGGPGLSAGQVPPTAGTFDAMLEGALNANKAGVKVFLDLMDLTDSSACQGASLATVHAWMQAAAQRIAGYGFDPSMIAIGPINEPTGDDNATWDPILEDLHDELRQYLPSSAGWILTKGGAYWADPGTFSKGGKIFSDQATIYMVHYYPATTPPNNGDSAVTAEWAGVVSEVETYAEANGGVPVVLGESGLYNPNDTPYGGAPDPGAGAWPAVIGDTAKGAGKLRPMPWAVTDGSEPVSKGGSDATLPAAVEAAFESAASFIDTQSYYQP